MCEKLTKTIINLMSYHSYEQENQQQNTQDDKGQAFTENNFADKRFNDNSIGN